VDWNLDVVTARGSARARLLPSYEPAVATEDLARATSMSPPASSTTAVITRAAFSCLSVD
jgi:hypothetical protein